MATSAAPASSASSTPTSSSTTPTSARSAQANTAAASANLDDVCDSLIREYLKRGGMEATLASFDREKPRTATTISNRKGIERAMKIERIVRRNKERSAPIKSTLAMIVNYHVERGGGGGSKNSPGAGKENARSPAGAAPQLDAAPKGGLRAERERLKQASAPKPQPTGQPKAQPRPSLAPAAAPPPAAAQPAKQAPASFWGAPSSSSSRSSSLEIPAFGAPKPKPVVISAPGPTASAEPSFRLKQNTGASKPGWERGSVMGGTSARGQDLTGVGVTAVRQSTSTMVMDLEEVDDFDDDGLGEILIGPSVPGSQFSKPSLVSVGGAKNAPSSTVQSRGANLGTEEARGLQKLTLAPGAEFSAAWLQGLYFTECAVLPYGLWQEKGGPCGLLAALQAYVIKELFYTLPEEQGRLRLAPSAERKAQALVAAMAAVIWQAGGERRAIVVQPRPGAKVEVVASGGRDQELHLKRGFESKLVKHTFSDEGRLREFLADPSTAGVFGDKAGGGVTLLLHSLLLSRGLRAVGDDMDDANSTVIANHGYCTQEMVNLLLLGKAHTNIFDGSRSLGGSSLLKGVDLRSTIGYLTLFEAMNPGVVEAGANFKEPHYPVFVVCSESHFSLLFRAPPSDKSAPQWKTDEQDFDLLYYDGLARQDEEIRLSVRSLGLAPGVQVDFDAPPLELCIRTKWARADVDWNDSTPIL